jgi:hypothetical protein
MMKTNYDSSGKKCAAKLSINILSWKGKIRMCVCVHCEIEVYVLDWLWLKVTKRNPQTFVFVGKIKEKKYIYIVVSSLY